MSGGGDDEIDSVLDTTNGWSYAPVVLVIVIFVAIINT